MPEIPEIRIPEIRQLPANAVPSGPPITLELGFPIVEMPGCVPAHPDANLNPSLVEQDINRTGAFCREGEVPSFRPLEFSPLEYTPTAQPRVPAVPSDVYESTEAETNESSTGEDEEAGAPINLPAIPRLPQSDATIYRTEQEDDPLGKPLLEKALDGLPPVEAVVTTTTIALVAATAALVAKPFSDLILKLIKPTVKKVVKKVSQVRGKPVHVDSVLERRLAQRDRNRALRALRRALKP